MASKETHFDMFKRGFIQGTGAALGATFGFAVVVAVLGFVLGLLGGLPLIGNWFAQVVEATNQALEARKAFGR